jgi:hypothetical protein
LANINKTSYLKRTHSHEASSTRGIVVVDVFVFCHKNSHLKSIDRGRESVVNAPIVTRDQLKFFRSLDYQARGDQVDGGTQPYIFYHNPSPLGGFHQTNTHPHRMIRPSILLIALFVGAAAACGGDMPVDFNSPQPRSLGPECGLCKTIVKEMFHFLRENKTEANIISGLNRVCRMIYPSEPSLGECKSMVKAYTRELVQLLVDETDPEVICMLLEQCKYYHTPPQASSNHRSSASMAEAQESRQPDDLARLISALDPSVAFKSLRACVECKMFVKYLRDKLENTQSQSEIKQWLMDNLCKELPNQNLVDSCTSMVETYSDVFFKTIAGDLDPQAACVDLGVCNASTIRQVLNIGPSPLDSLAKELPSLRRKAIKDRRCNRCKDVVARIDDYLSSKHLNDDLDDMSKICDNTSMTKEECVSFARQYGSDIIQMIPNMESPRHLCQQLNEC